MVTLDAIVQVTLMNRPLTYATDAELRRLYGRYNQLADTFHATDPTTGVDVFKALEHIAAERRKRL
jgi:hypothetical protein